MGLELFKQQKSKDVFCPHCGTKAQVFLYKPACTNCHWNVRAAKGNILRQVRNAILPVAVFIAIAYFINAPKGPRGTPMLFYLWPLIFGCLMFGKDYMRLMRLGEQAMGNPLVEPPSAFPKMPILEPRRYNRTFLLFLLIETMAVLISGWVGYSSLPKIIESLKSHEVDFDMYILIAHFLGLGHLILTVPGRLRSIFIERKIASFGQAAVGTITSEAYGAGFGNEIEYEFRDLTGGAQRGKGRDFSAQLYEDMRVMILFNPSDPRENVPVCGLVTHRIASAENSSG